MMPFVRNALRSIDCFSPARRSLFQLQKPVFRGHHVLSSCRCCVSINTLSRRIAATDSKVCPSTQILPSAQLSRHTHTSQSIDDDTVIYEGTLTRTVRIIKIFSISTSAAAFCIQPFLYKMAVAGETSTTLALTMASMFAVFTVGTPLLLHWVTKRYVTQITFDKPNRSFTVNTLSLLAQTRQMQFTAADVSPLHVASAFCNIMIKGRLLLIDPMSFSDREAYIHMMGYDEPMDLHLPPSGDEESEQQEAISDGRKQESSKE